MCGCISSRDAAAEPKGASQLVVRIVTRVDHDHSDAHAHTLQVGAIQASKQASACAPPQQPPPARPHLRLAQLGVNELVAADERDAKLGGHHLSAGLDLRGRGRGRGRARGQVMTATRRKAVSNTELCNGARPPHTPGEYIYAAAALVVGEQGQGQRATRKDACTLATQDLPTRSCARKCC